MKIKSPLKLKKQDKAKVFIVDDHPIVREGLSQLIHQEEDLRVCGVSKSASEALEFLRNIKPEIAIVDLSLKGASGIDLIKEIKARYPHLLILVLSMHDESIYAERVLRAGARGYIMKQEDPGKVMEAIRKILAGDIYVSPKMSMRILEKTVNASFSLTASPVDMLSDRELEVFQMIGRGMGTRQIAKEIFLSIKTVETYKEHIKDKMNLDNATALVRQAVQWVESNF